MDYLRKNHLSLLIIAFLVLSFAFGGETAVGVVRDSTNWTNPQVFNTDGDADTDFTIEGDTDTALFFADASTDRIGISTAAPSVLFDVDGVVHTGTLTQGGGVHATTSPDSLSAYTLIESEIDTENVIEWENELNITLTLPATSTLTSIIPDAGDVRQYYFQNASSTAAATITFAAGTGIDLQFAEATGGDLVLNGLDWAKLTFIRQNDTDVTVIFDEMTEAD